MYVRGSCALNVRRAAQKCITCRAAPPVSAAVASRHPVVIDGHLTGGQVAEALRDELSQELTQDLALQAALEVGQRVAPEAITARSLKGVLRKNV